MINIKIILLLGLAAYVACRSGKIKGTTNKNWYNDDSDSSESISSSEDSEDEVYWPKQPNGLNNKRKGNAKVTAGDKDFSRTGVGKQGLSVECTDDGALVNGKLAPEYDVRNQPHFDMTGNGMKINGQQVGDTGSRQGSKTDKRYQRKGGNNIGLPNSNNINTNNVNWNNMNSSSPRPKQHGKAKSNIPAKSPKQKTTVANNQGCGAGGTLSNFGNFGNQGVSSNITVAGNLIGNPKINIERTADGFKINGKIVPGVNPYNVIEIDWYPQGGIAVNGDYKTGFEDIIYSGRTILASISNPAYNNGSGPSQAPDKRYQKKGGNNIGLANSNNINSSNVNLNNINSSSPIEDSEDEVYMPKPYGKAKSKIPTQSPKQKPTVANIQGYGAGENFGWQYNNRNNKDVQFNNVGNRGRQFNNIGNRGTQINNQGNGGVQCINSGNIVDYSGSESSGYDTSDSMQFDGYNTV
ncbi:putative uncharacterized protein DDB_G0286901 [Adelges cooleyi]|uniref:putative uncharacterized protein DDB_G0286901 n=1 Tax=Adelges cooleyi TaxID=133065 RepID=UPI0021808D65|nr:putative uncharacterized protein DDB_G0286901 [Adelges cooleyi]